MEHFRGLVRDNPAVRNLRETVIYGLILVVVPSFISDYSITEELADRLRDTVANKETFDFIVVGGGTAGLVVANRLSENFRVLVLEAGGDPNPLQSIPGFAPLFLNQSQVDWRYFTTKQNSSCLALQGQRSFWPRGKGLGGSSNLNYMMYIRGHPLDYDNWAYITGDGRWSYANLLPFFLKAENYTGPYRGKFHGENGPLNVEPESFKPYAKYFLQAAQELGYTIQDLNAPYVQGFSQLAATKKNGRRCGSFHAFLLPIRDTRKNLTVRKYSLVTRILFRGLRNEAYGVEYERHGTKLIALATKEIIISAGTIGSPKILMLSGVGPQEHLRSFGIQPIVDLPGVGQNLQDHIYAPVGPFLVNTTLSFLIDRDLSMEKLQEFLDTGTGPLSYTGLEATGSISTVTRNTPHALWPDLQLLLFGYPVHARGPETIASTYNMDPEVSKKFFGPLIRRDSFQILSICSRPKSKGGIYLKSANPLDPPVIDPNYLSVYDDVRVIREGIKKSLEMVENTTAFLPIAVKLSPIPFPTCAHFPFRSDAYWDCFIRHFTMTVYHPVGTCAMGRRDNFMAVVDSTLKVLGTRGLRVIDASVMPKLISTNTQAITFAIGERGAQFILEDWGNARSGTDNSNNI